MPCYIAEASGTNVVRRRRAGEADRPYCNNGRAATYEHLFLLRRRRPDRDTEQTGLQLGRPASHANEIMVVAEMLCEWPSNCLLPR
jgi:hypothetical protein